MKYILYYINTSFIPNFSSAYESNVQVITDGGHGLPGFAPRRSIRRERGIPGSLEIQGRRRTSKASALEIHQGLHPTRNTSS